jgi:hypothetical protein
VFTARYGLGPYITQIRFVFKQLKINLTRSCQIQARTTTSKQIKMSNVI